MGFMAARFAALPEHLHVRPVAVPREVILGRLEVEADEMWSLVATKANKHWVWIAMEKQTRHILAFHVGDRSHASAQQWWTNLPAVYREQATFYTDQYAVYTGIIPAAPQSHDEARPQNESYRALQYHAAAARLPPRP
jgi:IS1 family transposase